MVHATKGRNSVLNFTDPPLHIQRRQRHRVYRVFLLGHNGRITGSRDLNADDDEQAIAEARALRLPCKCEVWERARVLAELPEHRG